MTNQQKQFALALVNALSTRRPTEAEIALIQKARVKAPVMFAWAEKCAVEVRRRVDSYMLDTWEQTARDEADESDGGDFDGYEGGWPFVPNGN